MNNFDPLSAAAEEKPTGYILNAIIKTTKAKEFIFEDW